MQEDQSPLSKPPHLKTKQPVTTSQKLNSKLTVKNKKTIKILGLILIFAIFTIFTPIPYFLPKGFYCKPGGKCPHVGWNLGPSLWQIISNWPTSGPPHEESYTSTPAPETNNKPSSSIETSNWESFASSGHFNNLDNEFQIKYPKTLREDYSDGPFGSSVLLYKEGFELDISISSKQDSINSENDIASKFVQDTINRTLGMGFNCNLITSCELKDFSTNVININRNTTAGSVKGPGRSENSVSEAYIVLTGSKSIQLLFHFNNDYENRAIRDQILSTFKFLGKGSETNLKEICDKYEGVWLEDYSECESVESDKGIDEKLCIEKGGIFNECASNLGCRHSDSEKSCLPTAACIKLCNFKSKN